MRYVYLAGCVHGHPERKGLYLFNVDIFAFGKV